MSEPIRIAAMIPTIVKTVNDHRSLLIIPTVGLTFFALLYSLARPTNWQASQALMIRDEVIGNLERPAGQFVNPDAMKTAQETILELAQNRKMIKAALIEANGEKSESDDWPSAAEVDQLRSTITVEAPRGAEFGQTEVIYLSLIGPTPERATTLTTAVCNQLEAKLRQVRDRKAQSVIDELAEKVSLAKSELDDSTAQLKEVEEKVGSDLGDLRILNSSGNSRLRGTLNDFENELREARTKQTEQFKQKELLAKALQDPKQLVATPNQLLEWQPSLQRLKDGLIDAKLRTANMLSKMKMGHPLVRSAIANEQEVRDHLHDELKVSLLSIEDDLRLGQARIDSLEKQKAKITKRLDTLAAMRAGYSNLVGEVKNRAQSLEEAEKGLAESQASQTAAQSSSLITQLDEPQVGNSPVGPGRSLIVLAGMAAGLMSGIGLITLIAPIGAIRGRRWTDQAKVGRRAADQKPIQQVNDSQRTGRRVSDRTSHGRRASDQTQPQPKPQGNDGVSQDRRASDG